ncbi:MAG TPA: DinB family protein [Longimicrobium sp.]|nr:DinB family protein [Longimicrobium sp.]
MTRADVVQRQTDHVLQRLLRTFDKAVGMIPPEHLDFRPTPENMSAKAMAHHVYQIVLLTSLGVEKGEVTKEDAGSVTLDLMAVERAEALVDFGARVKERARAALSGLTEEALDREIRYYFGMKASGEDSLRNMMEEVLHHRGQMQVYLRLMGIKPPSIRDFS